MPASTSVRSRVTWCGLPRRERGPTHELVPILRTDRVALHYEVAGVAEAPPVVLVQGCGVCGSGWRPQIEVLAGRHQVLSFDNRGIGRSEGQRRFSPGEITTEAMTGDVLALMDHLGWPSAHVVGHSMGGVVAQELALSAPERVRSLSLLCTFHRGSDATRVTPWMLWVGLRTRIGTRASRRRAFLEMVTAPSLRAARSEGDLDALAEELGELFGRDLADSPPILMQQLRALGRYDASARLGELARFPTLVVSGREDRVAPAASGRALAGAIPGARYVEIPDAAHALTVHAAAELGEVLVRHIEGAEASPTR